MITTKPQAPTLDAAVPHYETSRWREWCVARGHPGTTFNPLLSQTWCACGEVITPGDTATHDLCCGGFMGELRIIEARAKAKANVSVEAARRWLEDTPVPDGDISELLDESWAEGARRFELKVAAETAGPDTKED